MPSLLARLQACARERDYRAQADPLCAESAAVLATLRRRGLSARLHLPGNDAYAHRIDIELGVADDGATATAEALIRFDLRAYVLLAYRVRGALRSPADDEAGARPQCAAIREVLDAANLEELAPTQARTTLSPELLERGFIDDSVLAYFFESR